MVCNFSEMKRQNDLLENKLQALKKEYRKPQMSKEQVEKMKIKMEEAKAADKKEHNKARMIKFVTTAAAFVGAFTILVNTSATIAYAMEQIPIIGQLVEAVTWRHYEYQSNRNNANIDIPEIMLDNQIVNKEVLDKLEYTKDEINTEIRKTTDKLIEDFEANLGYEDGYQDIIVKGEVLATTQDYFVLKLMCYQGAGSGYQWNYYYTIDLRTGERLQLKDIFIEGADYITPISENIKEQMRSRMQTQEDEYYWLDGEIEELNFKAITEDASFFLNEKGNVVISFNEGEVAPMFMGVVEFEIPADVLSNIRK